MRALILFFIGILTIFMFACKTPKDIPEIPEEPQEIPEIPEIPGYDISKLGIDMEDANRKLTDEPTGEVYVENIKIDFGLNELMEYRIKTSVKMEIFDPSLGRDNKIFEGDIYAVSTLGRLVYLYQKNPIYFVSWPLPESRNCDYVFPKLEYSLAQQCFQDSCSSVTRKAVLQRAINIQESIFEETGFTINWHAIRSNIFLMAVILAKENDVAFMAAVSEDQDLQNALCIMNYDSFSLYDKELSNYVKQFAINFLSNQ